MSTARGVSHRFRNEFASGTILVVDDDLIGQETLVDMLEADGYRILTAANGPDALVLAAEHLPDVIILDVMMPGMSGFDVCESLRADPRTAMIPVIMVTALSDRKSHLQGLEAGADDFITKPFDRLVLRARVRTTVRLNRYQLLNAERTKFELVVENSESGYMIVTDDDRSLFANPRMRQILDLADKAWPVDVPVTELAARTFRLEPENAWLDWPNPRADSTPRYLIEAAPVKDRPRWYQVETLADITIDGARAWMVNVRDVTEFMRMQMSTWSFERSVFHKLRTPLGSLIGGLDSLRELEIDRLSDEGRLLLQMAEGGARRLHADIGQVLAYVEGAESAHGAAGSCALVQIRTIIQSLQRTLDLAVSVTSAGDGSGYDGSGYDDSAYEVAMPARSVELILQELFSNACKFHPAGRPSIRVTMALRKTDNPAKHAVQLVFRDDGPGIAEEDLANVWAPYYQSERSFTGNVPGVGLGLARIASMVWSVGGRCRLYNAKPGLAVELTLPMRAAAKTQ